MNDIKTIDERIRAKAREEFAVKVKAAIRELKGVSGITTAIKDIVWRDKNLTRDVTDTQLIELLERHIIANKAAHHEEIAVQAFLDKYSEVESTSNV